MVFRARDRRTGRDVALKLVMGPLDRTRRERFQREAEVTGALQHPGIVRVHSAGIGPGDRPYIAYELVDGASLDGVLPGAPRRRRLELVRDVKPQNVLVDREGRARVADFGLAAAGDLERLTRSGTIVGTPSYMAPEQITGVRDAIGAWSDVWSLGVILYQALTDTLPFEADNLVSLSAQIASKDPTPPRSIDPTVPRDLEAVCLKALSRAPAERYQDGEALAVDLDHALRGEHVSAVRPPLLRRFARPLLWATPVVLSLGALVTALALAPAPPEPEAPAAPAAVSSRRSPGAPTPAATSTEAARPHEWSFEDPPPTVVGSSDIEQLAVLAQTEAMPMRLLGNAYMKGQGDLAVNPRVAANWWYRAVQAGDVDAMLRLGRLLRNGASGVPTDHVNAASYLERAAAGGSSEAMHLLGELYSDLASPLRDDATAARWLRRAGEQGERDADVTLARLLLEGRGDLRGDAADRAAVELLRKASDLGHDKAAFLLGRLMLAGRGCEQDGPGGLALIERAAQGGDIEAEGFLRRRARKVRGED